MGTLNSNNVIIDVNLEDENEQEGKGKKPTTECPEGKVYKECGTSCPITW